MKKTLLLILFLNIFSGQFIFSQNFQKTDVKPFPLFLDFGIGYAPVFGAMADFSSGFRFNDQLAIGIGAINFGPHSDCCLTYATGIGLQARWTPARKFIFKLEGGRVIRAFYGDDGSYLSVYDKAASNRIYFRTIVGYRIFRICNIGLTYAQTGKQFNENRDYDTNQLLAPIAFTVKSLFIHLGITLPGAKKK